MGPAVGPAVGPAPPPTPALQRPVELRQLQPAPRQPGEQRPGRHNDVDDIGGGTQSSGVSGRRLVVEGALEAVGGGTDVEVCEGEGGTGGQEEEQPRRHAVGPLRGPVYEADPCRLVVVSAAAPGQQRGHAERRCCQPRQRDPTHTPHARHQRRVPLWLLHPHVVVHPQPRQRVHARQPADGAAVRLGVTETVGERPWDAGGLLGGDDREDGRPEGEGGDEETEAEVSHRQRREEVPVGDRDEVRPEDHKQRRHVGDDNRQNDDEDEEHLE